MELIDCTVRQAMVHELIGIQDNKVDLKSIGKFPKDQQVELYFLPILQIFVSVIVIW